MSDFKVVNKTGEWFINRALFRFVDPTNETNPVVFEPGVPTKVIQTDWMKGQELIVPCPDPNNSDDPMPTLIDTAENTVIPNDDVSGEPDKNGAPGILGSPAAPVAKKK